MRAYLWTPEELVQLDLLPMREREVDGLARLDLRNQNAVAPLISLAKRNATKIELIDLGIRWARELPAEDEAAAAGLVARLQTFASRGRQAHPTFVLERIAECVWYRLRLHVIKGTSNGAPVPGPIRTRAAALRSAGRLVMRSE